MDISHPNSFDHEECSEGGDIEESVSTPRWWVIVWLAWGLVVGLIVLWLDRDPIAAALWLIAGLVIGTCAPKLLLPFTTPVFDWFHKFSSDPERERRMVELAVQEKLDTEEFNRLSEDQAFDVLLMVPLMCGLFHGTLLGGVGGALVSLDSTLDITASQGALYGILLGVVGVSFLDAIALAVMTPADKRQPLKSRIARRARMLVSPILVFPVVWHCGKWIVKRRAARAG
jgi:hypothetical protein